jgi:hypothetical protein
MRPPPSLETDHPQTFDHLDSSPLPARHLPDRTVLIPRFDPSARFFAGESRAPPTSSQQVACHCDVFHPLSGLEAWEMVFLTSHQMGAVFASLLEWLPPLAP